MNVGKRAPVQLVESLRAAREHGRSFDESWPWALLCACEGRPDGEDWREAFEETEITWRRAYERVPATGPERAIVAVVEGIVLGGKPLPDRPCAWCGGEIDPSAHPKQIYCSELHRKKAAVARERVAA